MAITDYIPNVFGSAAPTTYEGLLGTGLISPEQMKQTQNTANIQGLLGAGLALAQGMSKIGPRRSAAENILGALAGGFGAAGGAYQQGLQNVVQQQQLQSAALTQAQAANKIKSIQAAKLANPDIAYLADIDTGKFAEEVSLRQRIKGIGGGTGEVNTPEAYRALGQQYLAGGSNLKPLGEAYMKQADALELTSLGNLKGDESPEELDKRSTRAYALGSKDLAERLFGLAEQKRMYPDQVQAAPQAQDLAQREAMPEGQIITKSGEVGGYGKPNFDAGERYADEELNKQFQPLVVTEPRGRQGQLQLRIDNINRDIERISGMRPTAANRKEVKDLSDLKDKLQVDLNRIANMEYDFKSIKEGLPKKYHSEIDAVERLAQAGNLDSAGIRSSVENFYTRLQEDEKGRKLEGNAALFAQMKFGVTDRAQLNGQQLAEILRFETAPNAEQLAKLQQTNRQLQFETGAGVGLPAGRQSMISPAPTTAPTTAPTVSPTAAAAPTTTAPRPAGAIPTAAPTAVPTAAPENAPPQTRGLYQYNKTALINQPDSKYSPKKKMELREKQAPLQSAVNYSLTSIKDSLDAAQALKNNPQYIDALTGRFSPFLTGTVGGVVISQDAKTANALLENILTRTFVSEIQAMRDASPTGGAVGSVTEKEMDALSRIRASLSVGMNKDEFIKQLDNYLSIANRSLKNIPIEYSKTFGYNGEFDEILTTPAVSTSRTSGQDPVQQELERRRGRSR